MSGGEYLTVPEAAAALGVQAVTIWTAIAEERLPAQVIYGRKVVAKSEVEAYRSRTQPEGMPLKGRPRKQKGGEK